MPQVKYIKRDLINHDFIQSGEYEQYIGLNPTSNPQKIIQN